MSYKIKIKSEVVDEEKEHYCRKVIWKGIKPYIIPGGGRGGVLSLFPQPEEILSLYPTPP